MIRVDAWRYLKRPTTKYKGKILPERLQIGYKIGDWKLTVGDFYKQLGRGLVLSFRKGDEVSADTAIRGGELVYSASGHKVTLFGGYRNQANFDPVTKLYYDEEDDSLAGFQYVYSGFDLANLGCMVCSISLKYERLSRTRILRVIRLNISRFRTF